MKKTIKLAVVAALALGTTSAFATNGDALIGMGTKTRGMGGTSIGIAHGSESGLSNPALITTIKSDHEISFGGTLFMPNVKTTMSNPQGGNQPEETSAADTNVIPEVSIANKVNDNFYWGIGMWGTAGMGVDFRDAATSASNSGNMQMVTNLQLMQFGVPLAYTTNGFSAAVTPILQYGALDINYNDFQGNTVGAGVAQDLAFGYNVGLAYTYSGVTIGAVYKSAIEMEYKGQLSNATQPFVDFGIFPGALSDKLEQPAEIGVGASYQYENNTIALDYKQIKWSSAKGYEDFGWDDQNVVAVGYEYAVTGWAVRLGYNYASQPIQEAQSGPAVIPTGSYAQAGGNALNTFNIIGFPATTESHYTLGGTYTFSDVMSIDGAFTYAPETTTIMKGITGFDSSTGDLYTGDITVKHSQTAVSVALTYEF
jgi:long-chain fatty acid transport protein